MKAEVGANSGCGGRTAPGSKRKAADDQSSLEDTIKRFRITNTPGEIRLSKDLKDVAGLPGVQFILTDHPASVVVQFSAEKRVPARFLVEVSRYYPHNSPTVLCLESGFDSHLIVGGEVTHANLIGWSAIGTLGTVLGILEEVRGLYRDPVLLQCHRLQSLQIRGSNSPLPRSLGDQTRVGASPQSTRMDDS
ncbi:hypothetical protein B484DRAFT_457573 [Ochromonadaceae sp. CCMP2298]|nr:hypothetical protein B484DRAFT_457573 [Ochromonadaceae sp. CCMP2298]|eukprot:CAMPEP_0173302106 /NCGR_PEP_ID=MMETSP1143-20121109/18163_1 /TAXON_ID=483371 /ORGANISM="non described non described, Strain CCMP2298" /LENGTH=191 /DNA_ID=CAMNT_0014242695 /DNA_START=22 /DNA_END=600 /DNA_ORIENTATION=+